MIGTPFAVQVCYLVDEGCLQGRVGNDSDVLKENVQPGCKRSGTGKECE